MKYSDLKTGIRDHLNNAAEDFFMVGYYLRQISEGTLFIEDGYKSIWEFAKGEYGLSTSSASRFMAINARFSIDGGEHMDQKYIGMGPSKLQEMLGLSDEDLEKVTQETTVKELRAMKAAKLSFYKLPKTEYEEGSLLTTPGCGHKYSCFSCSRVCNLRQEERQCVISTCGNPKPCTRVNADAWADMASGLYKEECLFLQQDELAEHRAGDNEPTPCCRACKYKGLCYSSCDVAKAEAEAEKKKEQEELRRQQQEAEARKPEPSDRDIKAFYDHEHIKPSDTLTAAAFKEKWRNAGGGGGGYDYQGSARGIRINHKREITWAQLTKRLKEIQEQELKKQEKETAPTEAEYLTEFYERDLYPSTRQLIKGRDKAAITKLFKQEYGAVYENGTRTNGSSYNCYPDKIVFRSAPGEEGLQITWGRFVTKLIKLLEDNPKIEQGALDYDARKQAGKEPGEQEPEVIDAEFREVEDVKEPERQEAEADQEPAQEIIEAADPEAYGLKDIKELLDKHERDLKEYRTVEGLPEKMMKKQRILTDALQLLYKTLKEKEAADID